MPDEKKYFQLDITVGIEATSMEEAETLSRKFQHDVAVALHSADSPESRVFETFMTQPYPYAD